MRPSGVSESEGSEAARTPDIAAELATELADVVYALRIHPTLAFEYLSASVLSLSGYSPEELYADPAIALGSTDPEDDALVKEAFAAPPGVVSDFTVRWRTKDGRLITTHHRCRKHVRDDGSVVVYAAARDVTAQAHAEAALAASEAAYRMLAENASDIVWRTTPDGVVEWVSPSVTAVLGWSPSEMVGGRIMDFVHPEDHLRVRAAGTAANGGDRVFFEARYLCKDGSPRWLEVTARPLLDAEGVVTGKVGSCRDVHSEVEAYQALERSEQRFRLTMESAPTGMAVIDLDGRFVEVNSNLCRMLGQDASWVLAHRLSDVVHPSDDAIDLRMRDEVLSGRTTSATHELRLVRNDRASVWVQHSIGLLRDEEGVPVSYVSQFVNVTEAREAREALHFMATHDSLTHLLNRSELVARMSRILAHAPRSGSRLAVLYTDLDGLKVINDTHGHATGDQLIIEASLRIAHQLRDDDLAARIGGDEFVVVLPHVSCLADAEAVADKLHDAVRRPARIDGHDVEMSISIGIALSGPGVDAATLLRQADAALYRAKRAGRSRTEAFEPMAG